MNTNGNGNSGNGMTYDEFKRQVNESIDGGHVNDDMLTLLYHRVRLDAVSAQMSILEVMGHSKKVQVNGTGK